MATRTLSIYLAGAIRDGIADDINWREDVINQLQDYPVRFMNPLAGKEYDPITREWTVSGQPSSARFITRHDKWYIEQSDVVIFNFRALSQGYANIGTLVEFGMAVASKKLIYTIVDPDYRGHGNQGMYKLHPFLAEFSSEVFPDVPIAISFLKRHLTAMSGLNPHFAGRHDSPNAG